MHGPDASRPSEPKARQPATPKYHYQGAYLVFLSEPPRTQWDLSFSLFGFPVRVHPLFWLVGTIMVFRQIESADLKAALLILVPWIVAFFISILVHELGHALVMRRYGFSSDITLYAFGGMASYGHSRGMHLDTWKQVGISAAGPGAGFLLAAGVIGLLKLTGHDMYIWWIGNILPVVLPEGLVGSEPLTWFVKCILLMCFFWGFINLMPVYPLDGGQIARELFLRYNPRDGIRQSLILSTVTATCVAIIGFVMLKTFFMVLFFGYLAYMSYTTLQAYRG